MYMFIMLQKEIAIEEKKPIQMAYKVVDNKSNYMLIELFEKYKSKNIIELTPLSKKKVIILFGMVMLAKDVYVRCSSANTIKSFDPFEILEVEHGSSEQEIRKAYR